MYLDKVGIEAKFKFLLIVDPTIEELPVPFF